jgi:two-component system cell cycle response regulator CpdR
MLRILIVDDESGIRSILCRVFKRAGYEVRSARHVREAMELCASERFDALLSDVQMPDANGHELVRWVVRSYPGIRCILMTAFDDIDCRDCPFALRCRFIEKPFDPKDAVATVERFLHDDPPSMRGY